MKTILILLLVVIFTIECSLCYTCPQWTTQQMDSFCRMIGPRKLPSGSTIAGDVEYKSTADNCCYRLKYSHSGTLGTRNGYCTVNWDTDDAKVDLDWHDTPIWVCVP
ncbi:hypothetical protein ABK040_016008 [Willaertia magna]